MAISIDQYIDITSGVAGATLVKDRELILRVFTTSIILPALTVREFTSSKDVGAVFGLSSSEYLIANKYFAFISKSITAPKKISFYKTDATPLLTLINSSDISNNFGTFMFVDELLVADITAVANWNTEQNVRYGYLVPVTTANAVEITGALANTGGSIVTMRENSTSWDEVIPAMLLASTDYTRPNSTKNYMFQTPSFNATVTTDLNKQLYDGLKVNYVGQTQQGGQKISFYQTGVMFDTNFTSANTFFNEVWLKARIESLFLGVLLSEERISANIQGRNTAMSILAQAASEALNNGTISVGTELTLPQKLAIKRLTDNDFAHTDVSDKGYFVGGEFKSTLDVNGVATYFFDYILVYKKDDVINKVNGSNIAI